MPTKLDKYRSESCYLKSDPFQIVVAPIDKAGKYADWQLFFSFHLNHPWMCVTNRSPQIEWNRRQISENQKLPYRSCIWKRFRILSALQIIRSSYFVLVTRATWYTALMVTNTARICWKLLNLKCTNNFNFFDTFFLKTTRIKHKIPKH